MANVSTSSEQVFFEDPTAAPKAEAEDADATADSPKADAESDAANTSGPDAETEAPASPETPATPEAAAASATEDETETSPPTPASEAPAEAAASTPPSRKRAKSVPGIEPDIPFINGFLMKKGDWGFRWSRRYFEVHIDGSLRYFLEKKEGASPKGQFPLLGSTVRNTTVKKKDWTFELKMPGKKKAVILAAANEEERTRWVDAMSDFQTKRKEKVLEHMNMIEAPFYDGPLGLKLGVANRKYNFVSVVKIEAVMESTQACGFDLVENDRLLKVNDTYVAGKKYPEVIKLLKGQMRPMTLTFGRWKINDKVPEPEEATPTPKAVDEGAAAAGAAAAGAVSNISLPDADSPSSPTSPSGLVSPRGQNDRESWMAALYASVHNTEAQPTREEFEAFIAAHAGQQFECTVSDPEEHQESVVTKKFVSFRVITRLTDDEMWSVTRRYSDFVQLREVLCARYVGLFIPKLKRTRAELSIKNTVAALKQLGKGNSDYIQKRMRGLGVFMNRIIAQPYLRSDVTVTDFLREQDRKQFESLIGKKTGLDVLTKVLEKTSGVTDRANKSHEMWIYACNTSPMHKNSHRLIEDLKKQLINQQKALRAVLKNCEALNQQLEDRAAAFGRFAELTTKLQEFEARIGDPSKNEYTQAMSADIVGMMESTNQIVSGWQSSASLSGPIFSVTVTMHFNQALTEVDGMLDMIKDRERLAASARRSTNNHTKLQAKRKAGQTDESLERKITDMDRLQKLQHFSVEFMTKGMLNHSVKALRKRRKRTFLECAIQWASSQGTHLDKELATANVAIAKMGVEEGVTRAQLVQILQRAKELFPGQVFDMVLADLSKTEQPEEEKSEAKTEEGKTENE